MESPLPQTPPRLNFFSRMLDNPVILKEFKGRMRGKQGFVTLTAYLMLIGFLMSMIYLVLYEENSSSTPGYLEIAGKSLFAAVVLTELSMIGFIGPALTSGAISSERERQTFDLLRVSLLSPSELVFGKLNSAVFYLLLLIFAAIPMESLAFFLGGVGVAELLISTLMLVVTAVFFCALGLFFSSFTKRTLVSTVLTYGSYLMSFIFLGFIFFFMALSSSLVPAASSQIFEDVLFVALWCVFSVNPFFAAIVSEVILVEEQSLFITNSGLLGASSIPFVSPWIIYVVFHLCAAALLILVSAYFVGRVER